MYQCSLPDRKMRKQKMAMIDEASADIARCMWSTPGCGGSNRLPPELILAVEDGDPERARIVADHIALINSMLHIHHTGEDKHLWPKLLTRGAREIAPLVHTVERQHQGWTKPWPT
jgi:hypothetical protein